MKFLQLILLTLFIIVIAGCGVNTEKSSTNNEQKPTVEETAELPNEKSSYEIIGVHNLAALKEAGSVKYANDFNKIYIRHKVTGCLKEVTVAHGPLNDGGFIYSEDYLLDQTGKPMCGMTSEEAKTFFDHSME